jgi:hypothetical protein
VRMAFIAMVAVAVAVRARTGRRWTQGAEALRATWSTTDGTISAL